MRVPFLLAGLLAAPELSASVSAVVSLERQTDGTFRAACDGDTEEVVSVVDIRSDNLCPRHENETPEYSLTEGTYVSSAGEKTYLQENRIKLEKLPDDSWLVEFDSKPGFIGPYKLRLSHYDKNIFTAQGGPVTAASPWIPDETRVLISVYTGGHLYVEFQKLPIDAIDYGRFDYASVVLSEPFVLQN